MRLRKLLTLLSGMVVAAGGLLLTATPALAVTGSMCTSSGAHLCVNSANFNHGTSLTTGGGARTVNFTGAIATNGKLELTGGSDACITAYSANSYTLKIESCSSTGVEWTFLDTGNNTRGFKNVHYPNRWIAGDNFSGDVLVARPQPAGGWYFKWQPL